METKFCSSPSLIFWFADQSKTQKFCHHARKWDLKFFFPCQPSVLLSLLMLMLLLFMLLSLLLMLCCHRCWCSCWYCFCFCCCCYCWLLSCCWCGSWNSCYCYCAPPAVAGVDVVDAVSLSVIDDPPVAVASVAIDVLVVVVVVAVGDATVAVFVIDDPTVAVAFVAVVFDGSAYQFEFIKYSTVAKTKIWMHIFFRSSTSCFLV